MQYKVDLSNLNYLKEFIQYFKLHSQIIPRKLFHFSIKLLSTNEMKPVIDAIFIQVIPLLMEVGRLHMLALK